MSNDMFIVTPQGLPIPEDSWIEHPTVSFEFRHRWQQWLAMPRYRQATGLANLKAILIAQQLTCDDGQQFIPFRSPRASHLTDLFLSTGVPAWAVDAKGRLLEFQESHDGKGRPATLAFLNQDSSTTHFHRLRAFLRHDNWRQALNFLNRLSNWIPMARSVELTSDASPVYAHYTGHLEGANAIFDDAIASGAISDEDRQRLLEALRRREDAIHRNAWGWLISHMDVEILALATCSKRLPSERAYHWIIEATGQERHNRAQATQLMPYLIDYFLLEKPDYRQSINDVIRQQRPLIPALATHFGLKPSTVRSLRKIPFDALDKPHCLLIRKIEDSIDSLPPEFHPTTDEEWGACIDVIEEVSDFTSRLEHLLDSESHLFARCCDMRNRLLRQLGRRGWLSARSYLVELDNRGESLVLCSAPIHSLAEVFGQFAYGSDDDKEFVPVVPIWAEPIFDWSLKRWLAVSRKWHKLQHVVHQQDVGIPCSPLAWEPLIAPHRFGDRQVVFLGSAAELEEEGRLMGHCVATRTRSCLTDRVHVASLRDDAGNRVSTLEVRLDNSKGLMAPVVEEHRGPQNKPISLKCEQAGRELIAYLRYLIQSRALDHIEFARLDRADRHGKLDALDAALRREKLITALEISFPALMAHRLRAIVTHTDVMVTEYEG